MKRIFSFAAVVLAVLSVCCSSDDAALPEVAITVEPAAVTAAGEGGQVVLTVTAADEWGIYCEQAWVGCAPSGGLKGSSTVTLTIAANPSETEARAAEVVVKAGATRVRIPVTQEAAVTELSIADDNLRAHLLEKYDANGDGIFSRAEAAALTSLDIAGKKIATFAELPQFKALESFDCSDNLLRGLDLAALANLVSLDCANNNLAELSIRNNPRLTVLDCTGNPLERIYVWAGFKAPDGFKVPDTADYILPDMFVPEGYTLLWSDEFDGTELNTANWTPEIGGTGWGNNELQYYTDRPQNVSIRDGCLVITAVKEEYSGNPATSARLITLDKFHFTYGYVVASIKLPSTADGLWPAFWMMGNDFNAVGWPKCGETDIMEMGHSAGISAGTQDRYFNGACHWGKSYANHVTYDYSLQDGAFHTFTCIWDEHFIRMYVDLETHPDAAPYFEMDITADGPKDIFHKDNFLLFNLAVGGNFPGIHDIGGVTALRGGSASMLVDYVRVFRKK